MNHVARIGRSLTRRAGALLTHRAAVPAAAVTPRPEPACRNEHSPLPAPARTAVTAELHHGTRPHRRGKSCTPSSCASTAGSSRPGSGSAARAGWRCAGPGACPDARDWTGTTAT